ncbi:MAG: hypothetical protein IT463_08445 [Planctomycetes bacterium]|nr:hypothetical protein [Planctomycetota bacterium]
MAARSVLLVAAFAALCSSWLAAQSPPADAPTPQPVAAAPAPAEPEWPAGLLPGPTEATKKGFSFEAGFDVPAAKPGDTVKLQLRFKMKKRNPMATESFHLYHPDTTSKNTPLKAELLGDAGFTQEGKWVYPEGHEAKAGDEVQLQLPKDTTLELALLVPSSAKLGRYRVYGHTTGQYCDAQGCIGFNSTLAEHPSRGFGWVAVIEVSADGKASATPPAFVSMGGGVGNQDPRPEQGTPALGKATLKKSAKQETAAAKEESSFFGLLLFAFLGGIVALLTPCVLPVLPLTIGFFVSQSAKGKSPGLTAFIYCSCIVASYTAGGLIMTAALGATGAQSIATNYWVNGFLAIMFLVFALNFLGLFELRVPAFITAFFSKRQMAAQKEGHGYAKAFFSGSAFSLISFSCTGPIAGTFLAQAASGDFWGPTAAMLAFSTGMALPIFIMGLFPGLMKKLPQSGGWMNAMKVVFGFVEIGLAIVYFSNAESAFTNSIAPEIANRFVVLAVWVVCSLLAGAYLMGWFRLPHDHDEVGQIGVVRTLIAMGFLGFGVFLLPGLSGGSYGTYMEAVLPVPNDPPAINMKLNNHHDLPWIKNDLDKALEEARKQNKPLFVDFTGFV